METWFIIILTLCISFILKSLFNLIFPTFTKKLPPGPYTFPVIGTLLWVRRSFADIEPILRNLKSKYGPLITLKIGSRPAIFVSSHSLAYQALVQQGAFFSDRPGAGPTGAVVSSNQRNISSAPYGPIWRLLRRNLTSEILHPSRVKSYSKARNWVLGILLQQLRVNDSGTEVKLIDHFQYAMFCLLVLMCFGDKLDETKIKEIESIQRRLLLGFRRFNILNFFPRVGKFIFRGLWKELIELRGEQENIFVPLIEARGKVKEQKPVDLEEDVVAYVDTLLNLELPEENRKLNHGEMVSLCSEFLSAGTDTTSTALQWVMANLVKIPSIQEKLYQEIASVVGPIRGEKLNEEVVKEEDLSKMPYLKAVILEGLRRHPPGHFVLPHTVTEEVELNGYTVPKNATINFMVADMGLDPKVWEDPLEFRPERFLMDGHKEGFDITCGREIKMMPFGAGRRICPGYALALLHLEYFVANLVWHFEWKPVEGDDVDLSEEQEFTVVMKNPLRARICPRV